LFHEFKALLAPVDQVLNYLLGEELDFALLDQNECPLYGIGVSLQCTKEAFSSILGILDQGFQQEGEL
jgi:hypothetical protein